MREHQIVISLKAEQFQEVQKLARAAGSQSVGAFVREHLLSFLGIGEADLPEAKTTGEKTFTGGHNPDFKFIAGELRRLHRELKILSSEASSPTSLLTEQSTISGAPLLATSLPLASSKASPEEANTQRESGNFTLRDLPLLKENFLTNGAPVATDDIDNGGETSLIMPSAGAAIPGSMSPVGMPFGYQSSMLSRSPYGMPLGGGHMMSPPFSQHGFITQPPPTQTPDSPAQSPAELPQGTPQTAVNSNSTPSAASDPTINEPPLEIVSMPQQAKVVPLSQEIQIPQPTQVPALPSAAEPVTNFVPNTPVISSAPPAPPSQNVSPQNRQGGSFTAQQDEMEVLAERAFAISPRLGAIEPQVAPQAAQNRSFADTLEELLDAGLINQVLAPSDEPEGVIGDIQSPGDFEDTTEIFDESLEEEVADNNWIKDSTKPDLPETPPNEPEERESATTKQEETATSPSPQAVPPTPERKDSIHETTETGTPTPPPRRKKSYKNE